MPRTDPCLTLAVGTLSTRFSRVLGLQQTVSNLHIALFYVYPLRVAIVAFRDLEDG